MQADIQNDFVITREDDSSMAKRLQVTLKDHEYRELQRKARAQRVSLAEWVRQALGIARGRKATGKISKKLEVIRTAARFSHPTADIEDMLAEIEKGYGGASNPGPYKS
jgi:hypothetical protein